jgi:Mannosyl-glycoprotein endo-beta-N-acetylglucosaminidase
MISVFARSVVVMFAGIVSLPSGISPNQAPTQPAPGYRHDPRLKTLTKFFHRLACPAEKYSAVFLEAADHYQLDWRLLPSLSFVETTGGKSARNNNFFGWDSGRAQFPSPSAAIQAVGYRLKHSSLYKNKKLDKLLAVYNSDAEYGQKVKSVMRRISPTE